jgi:hypothetical protein
MTGEQVADFAFVVVYLAENYRFRLSENAQSAAKDLQLRSLNVDFDHIGSRTLLQQQVERNRNHVAGMTNAA